MAHSEVIGALPRSRGRRFDARVPLAFMAIYFLWGATFLAIRIAVLAIPPFFTAGVRFLVAGGLLYGFMRLRGEAGPAAGAPMMLGGAVLLALSQLTGELDPFPHISLRAGLSLSYLIVGGSLLGFTAYVWLLARMPVTRVASHAYVNPVVGVALGYFVAG